MDAIQLSAIIWLGAMPLIFVDIIFAFLVIGHFAPVLRTIDAFFLSFLSALLLDILLLVATQAAIFLMEVDWPLELCRAYTWFSIVLRFAEVFTVLIFSIDRVLLIKLKGKYIYYSSGQTTAAIIMIWLTAAFIGIILIAGWAQVTFLVPRSYGSASGSCTYLAHELHQSFAICVIVLEVCTAAIAGFCLGDVWCHLKYYTNRSFLTINSREPG